MSHKFTIENLLQIERGTDQENEMFCLVKFKELKNPVEFAAHRISEDPQVREIYELCASGSFGPANWPPEHYPNPTLIKTQKELEKEHKETRNKLLAQTDYTQLPNAPLSETEKQNWEVYRQQLRDISKSPGFPYEFDWPDTPS